MLVATTNEIRRVMGVWIRRADSRLASGAARNAAIQLACIDQRRLEDARTMRDVRNLRPAESFTPTAGHREPHGAVL
jgi:hypothetical protein